MSWFWGKKLDSRTEDDHCSTVADEDGAAHRSGNDVSLRPDDRRQEGAGMNGGSEDADRVERKEDVQEGISNDKSENADHGDESADDDDDDETEDDGEEGRQHHHPPKSLDSATTDEDDISMIDDDSSDVDSIDDDFLDSSSDDDDDGPRSPESGNDVDDVVDDDDETSEYSPGEKSKMETKQAVTSALTPALGPDNSHPGRTATLATRKDPEQHEDANGYEESDDEEEQVLTSFWEKQSLLMLAAEHDRVDILKSILTDEDEDKERLMNGGIPPLHLAITFGSVNTTQSLLRMGADPSVRPNVDEILEQKRDQPADSKVEIANIRRFHGVSAWELAFGNQSYEQMHKNPMSWSIFGSS
jgi:hypothetical protein